MNEATLMANWQLALLVLGIVVLAAAALLIGIWWAARRILRRAVEALDEVQRIEENTRQIWSLKTTNDVAEEIASVAGEIGDNATAIAQTLRHSDDQTGAA